MPVFEYKGLNEAGKAIMTELTQEAEAQLSQIASKTNGHIVESKKGSAGVDEMTAAYQKMMREELSERVETLFAEVYAWPLFLAAAVVAMHVITAGKGASGSFGYSSRRRSARGYAESGPNWQ